MLNSHNVDPIVDNVLDGFQSTPFFGDGTDRIMARRLARVWMRSLSLGVSNTSTRRLKSAADHRLTPGVPGAADRLTEEGMIVDQDVRIALVDVPVFDDQVTVEPVHVDHGQMGFLAEGDRGPSSGGRAPRTLRFLAERGRIVVCALGALHIHVGISALDGDVVDDIHRSWEISRGPEETLDVVMTMLDELLGRNDDIPVWGVAVGLPGPVDFESGRPMSPPIMPTWSGHNVKSRFEQRFGAPVWVDNDVNLLALGERARRRDDNVDLVYCKTGTGIGVGLLSQGRIHRGASGSACDIGHLRVPGSTVSCLCGKTGCLEAVAGGWALVRDAEQAVAAGATGVLATALQEGSALVPESIAAAAEKGDPVGISLIQRSAQVVGEALASLVNTFNPAVIVLGGAIAAGAGELYLAEVRQRVYELALPLATRDLLIVRSVDDPREPLRGGAEMIREQLFDRTFARWFAGGRPPIEVSSSRLSIR